MRTDLTALTIEGYLRDRQAGGAHPTTPMAIPFTLAEWGAILSALRGTQPEELSAEPQWIVNDLGEMGVKLGNRFFFLYKGHSIEYETGLHDDGSPMLWRVVGKREFGETCWPLKWILAGRSQNRYTEELVFTPGLSFGTPEDGKWQALPIAPSPPRRGSDG